MNVRKSRFSMGKVDIIKIRKNPAEIKQMFLKRHKISWEFAEKTLTNVLNILKEKSIQICC